VSRDREADPAVSTPRAMATRLISRSKAVELFISAVDSGGQTIDFLLPAKRDAATAQRFFRKAMGQIAYRQYVPSRSIRTWSIREP
jgi:hypothetical protein